jgi:hypothetical protein
MASSFVIRIGGLAISPARRDYFTASDGYGSDGTRASSTLAEMLKGLGGCLGLAYASAGNAVAGMGADFRDFNDDGLDDIALSAMYFDTFPLFRNRGKPDFLGGYASSSEPLVRFGMGPYDSAKEISVRWPCGRVQVLSAVRADRVVEVRER